MAGGQSHDEAAVEGEANGEAAMGGTVGGDVNADLSFSPMTSFAFAAVSQGGMMPVRASACSASVNRSR